MKKRIKINYLIYFQLLVLMIISLILMYHAKIISPLFNKHFLKQSIFFIMGIICLLLKDKIKINWLFQYSGLLYIINCLLLLFVLFLGDTTNGAKAWFKLGFFSFQPSELMKLTLCLFLSKITTNQTFNTKKDEWIYLLKIILIILIPSF